MAGKFPNTTKSKNLDIYNIGNCIAIVCLRPIEGDPRPQVYYQVTIDQSKFTDDKAFIRFGDVHGDELVGWRKVTDIEVHHILHEYIGEIPYINQPKVEVA